jgi:hypothetical protein
MFLRRKGGKFFMENYADEEEGQPWLAVGDIIFLLN